MTRRTRRALCVTSNFPRWEGDSTTPFVLHLAQDLREHGWEVDVLAPHAPGAALRETLGGLRVERFRYAFPESAETVCYQGGALVNLRRRPLEKLKLPALVAAEWAAVWRRLVAGRYDVLHSHWVLPQGFVGMLASRLPRVRHVITLHGGDLFGLRGPLLNGFKRSALRCADAVTVNSSFTEAAVRELCPDLTTVRRIPMGVRTEPLSTEERELAARLRAEHAPSRGPLLVFVGRAVEEKGLGDALDALALLRAGRGAADGGGASGAARLLVVGEGQDRARFEARAAELGVADAVSFVGWVDPAAVRAHMAAGDIFVGPSRTGPDGWVEAQGLTFIEAMAVGTAVVGTRLGGIPDAVRHEETGLLVEERSPEQIAGAVRRLWEDLDLRQTLAESGQRLARGEFSRVSSAEKFAAVFERVGE